MSLDTIATLIGTGALVAATLVLALQTKRLHKATNVLARIEGNRDLRQALRNRIEFGQKLTGTEPTWAQQYLEGPAMRFAGGPQEIARSIRGLRPLIPKVVDPDLPDLTRILDFLIRLFDDADAGARISVELGREVSKSIDDMRGRLKNLLPRWRRELEGLYGE